MLLKSTTLPFSLLVYMVDDMSVVKEDYSFRPDNLVSSYYSQSMLMEAFCNEASNLSPISMSPGSKYFLPSRLVTKHFLEA